MTTITEFLLARIAEDEAAARKAWPGPWASRAGGVDGAQHQPIVMSGFDSAGTISDGCTPENGSHIARHDPTRVLAECEAKRQIIESVDVMTGGEKDYTQRLRHADAEDVKYQIARDMLRHLAAVYADHPDYNEAWKC